MWLVILTDITREREAKAALDHWLARKKHRAAYISSEAYGCPGGVFYCSMMKPNIRFIEHYVTSGFSGTPKHGERFLPSPEAMRKFLDKVNPREAPAKYCIFKPLSLFADFIQILTVPLVGYMFRPIDCLSIELFLYGDVHHGRGR